MRFVFTNLQHFELCRSLMPLENIVLQMYSILYILSQFSSNVHNHGGKSKGTTCVVDRDVTAYITGVIQKVLPVLSTEMLLHIWLSTEYYGFRPSSTAVDTWDTRGLMMSK